jgi:hypothetical protein
MTKPSFSPNQPLILALTIAVFILAGIVWWMNGGRDCEKRLELPGVETRYIPLVGCEVKIAGEWKSEDKLKDDINTGAKQMEEGAKKMMRGITGGK